MPDEETVNVRYMVDDVDDAIGFYTELLGFELLTNASPAFADVRRGNLRLLLAGPTSSAGRPMPYGTKPGPGGWNRIHFIVDDIDTEVARLRDVGAPRSGMTSSKAQVASRSCSKTHPTTSWNCSSPPADNRSRDVRTRNVSVRRDSMAQANAIIVRIRADAAEEFERLFEAEELPIWDEFVSDGTFLKARLARVEYGSEKREDVALYLIYAEMPGMAEHSAHDRDPRFGAFLEKARELQPESPSVFGGDVVFERG